jgi:aldehyde dehydrogenase (NAD+)
MLVSWEMGKIQPEGEGEVQEIIDICDFAVGLSRQLYGLTIATERPGHRMYEQWQPLGVVGVISAFNFPVAVWGWNAMLAAVCGNATIWKPSEKTPLCALACMHLVQGVLQANHLPAGLFGAVVGGREIGEKLTADPRVALLSATGSTRMGRSVGEQRGKMLGKQLLELGGNNAIIITPSADLKLAIQATVFAAVGTAGQRCTTARRLIVHSSVYDQVKTQLTTVYMQLADRVGNPLANGTLIGPLIDAEARQMMQHRLQTVLQEGGKLLVGGTALQPDGLQGYFVAPALVEVAHNAPSVHTETFAPILYLIRYETLEEAVAIQNEVPQGLSSSIFTQNLKEAEYFLSAQGSDCGIANVNIGPSGAEIGGAFGGEKETGGGRESGSDAWKAYMRRQTVTINYSDELPLAQGISFQL